MAAGKTGALLACAAAVGAVLAGATPGVVDALAAYGAELGLAFQLVDDLLGIWGDPARHRQAGAVRPARAQEAAAGDLGAGHGGAGRERAGRLAGRDRRRRRPTPRPAPRRAAAGRAGRRPGPGPPRRPAAARAWPSRRSTRVAACRTRSARRARGRSAATSSPRRELTMTLAVDRRRGPATAVPGRRRAVRQRWTRAVAHLRGLQDRRAGGRASWRPTSRWTPRTCCCGSSSASATAAETDARRRAGSAPSSAPTAPGPLPRRPRRPVHHRRGLGRAAAGRRRPGRAAHGARPPTFVRAQGGVERSPRVHPHLAGAVRPVVVGRPARPAAGADLPAARGSR